MVFIFVKKCYKKAIILKSYTLYIQQERRKEDTMTADMSGKFDYIGLRRTLKEKGVGAKDLSSALKQVGRDNDIDNIRELDKSEEITIAQSIFNDALSTQSTNLYASDGISAVSSEVMFPYIKKDEALKSRRIIGDGDSVMDLPEIYNDDEYDVVEYDEFYGFNDNNETNQAEEAPEGAEENDGTTQQDENGLSFEAFKEQYGENIAATNVFASESEKNEALKKIFNMFDTNSNEFLEQSELTGAFYNSTVNQNKDIENDTVPTEGDELLGNGMMDMDMSNDSFNPQG